MAWRPVGGPVWRRGGGSGRDAAVGATERGQASVAIVGAPQGRTQCAVSVFGSFFPKPSYRLESLRFAFCILKDTARFQVSKRLDP